MKLLKDSLLFCVYRNSRFAFNVSDSTYVAISSILLLVIPSKEIYHQVQKHFGHLRPWSKREMYDMDIINSEFSCRDKILVHGSQPY